MRRAEPPHFFLRTALAATPAPSLRPPMIDADRPVGALPSCCNSRKGFCGPCGSGAGEEKEAGIGILIRRLPATNKVNPMSALYDVFDSKIHKVNYPALKGGASCFMDNTCITEM